MSEAVSARIASAGKKFRELSSVLVGKHALSLKQQGKIYQCCVRPVLLSTVVKHRNLLLCCMIRMTCGVRLVDRVSTDILRDRVGVIVKIEDLMIQSRLQWSGHVMHGDMNSQMREVMEVEITGKRKKGRPIKLWEEYVKKDLEQYGLRRKDVFN